MILSSWILQFVYIRQKIIHVCPTETKTIKLISLYQNNTIIPPRKKQTKSINHLALKFSYKKYKSLTICLCFQLDS